MTNDQEPKRVLPEGVTEHRDRAGRMRYRARMTIEGRRKSLGLYDTPEDAGRAIATMRERLGGPGKGMSLTSWGAQWLKRRETDGIHRAARKDRSVWKHVAAAPFATWPLRKVARTDVVRWVRLLGSTEAKKTKTTNPRSSDPKKRKTATASTGRRLATQTIRNALGLLRRALGDAADEGYVSVNAALGVRVPRAATTEEPWSYLAPDEIEAVFAQKLTGEQRAVFTTAIYTGMRAGELWGLRWADVILDGARPELVVRFSYRGPTKGGRVRRVPLLRQAREALRAWRAQRPGVGAALVFPAEPPKDGLAGCHAEGFDAGWTKVRGDAGITRRVRFHDLRHTCASHLVMGTWGRAWRLEEVKGVLGHRSITTTERYAHLAPDGLHGARDATDAAGDTHADTHRDTEQKS